MKKQITLSVIVPTLNSGLNLKILLSSLLSSTYKNFEVIINDSPNSKDNTLQIISNFRKKKLDIHYYKENYSMAQARKAASVHASGKFLLHLDSDMRITSGLLGEIRQLLTGDFDALVIPEESYGTTFWAKCKWLEKQCYQGVEYLESLRAIKKSVYNKVHGHDKKIVLSEDKDLDIRVRNVGYKVGKTKHIIYHNEGNLSLWKSCKKKIFYINTADEYIKKHPREAAMEANLLKREMLYIKNYPLFFQHPLLFLGMVFMKHAEFFSAGIGYLRNKIYGPTYSTIR